MLPMADFQDGSKCDYPDVYNSNYTLCFGSFYILKDKSNANYKNYISEEN